MVTKFKRTPPNGPKPDKCEAISGALNYEK